MTKFDTAHVRRSGAPRRFATGIVTVLLGATLLVSPVGASTTPAHEISLADATTSVTVPTTAVGEQLSWLLRLSSLLPLSAKEESAHFDATFVAAESPAQLNQALASLGSTGSKVTLLSVSALSPTALSAVVMIGSLSFKVQLVVDSKGLISSLFFSLAKPVPIPKVSSWRQIDKDLTLMAPHAGFLAAQLGTGDSCVNVHAQEPASARPLGSMFKLFLLGALANAVKAHLIQWNQTVTVTAGIKVSGSGVLQNDADGTTLSVEQAAIKMISVSDNTAADILLALVGRSAVEAQVRRWTSHPTRDVPFLSVAEMFALKWHDFPTLANHYLALAPGQRLAYLTSTVDKVPSSAISSSNSPRDINSIEWFASPSDICRAFAGLSTLANERGLSPLRTILSTNNGGIELSATTWPQIWFKGGSEPGVLTLGYLARDDSGKTYVVVEMLENTKKPLASSSTLLGLGVATGALKLLRAGTH
jgi:beta-lactamase class A